MLTMPASEVSRGHDPIHLARPSIPVVHARRPWATRPTEDAHRAARSNRPEENVRRRLLIIGAFALALGMAVAGLALATPGGSAVPVELGRHTMPKLTAHFENRDIVVGEFNFAPGGFSGWHSHPGKVIVAVARGSITLYRGTDPACAGTTYEAGDLFVEHPGVVHEARNEGAVAAVLNVTWLGVPVGGSPRIDEPQPANCD